MSANDNIVPIPPDLRLALLLRQFRGNTRAANEAIAVNADRLAAMLFEHRDLLDTFIEHIGEIQQPSTVQTIRRYEDELRQFIGNNVSAVRDLILNEPRLLMNMIRRDPELMQKIEENFKNAVARLAAHR